MLLVQGLGSGLCFLYKGGGSGLCFLYKGGGSGLCFLYKGGVVGCASCTRVGVVGCAYVRYYFTKMNTVCASIFTGCIFCGFWPLAIFVFYYSRTAMFCHCTRAQSKFLQAKTFVDGFQSVNIKSHKNESVRTYMVFSGENTPTHPSP